MLLQLVLLLGGASLTSGLVSWNTSLSCGVTIEVSSGGSRIGDAALDGAYVIGSPVN